MRLYLEFAPSQGTVHRLRLAYAFRLFCAIWDHEPVLDAAEALSCGAVFSYEPSGRIKGRKRTLRLSNLYRPRAPQDPAPPPTHVRFDDERIPLFYAPPKGDTPDWLGEIFEWVSCADEYSVQQYDTVGRISFASSYVGRHGLDVGCPYAASAMRLLEAALYKTVSSRSTEPHVPSVSDRHFIVNTHDVDFLPISRIGSLKRLLKNAAVSLLIARSPRLALAQTALGWRLAATSHNALDQMPALLEGEESKSANASYFFIPDKRHRRDANYDMDNPKVISLLTQVAQNAEVGVHGSYTSLDHEDKLNREFGRLRRLGFHPAGGRQHWLRFTLAHLIPALERAGAEYDCSLGWSDRPGFRAGACFAFPPYDFKNERPARLLEFPLVMMDQALQECNPDGQTRIQSATRILATSRAYGWGGISVLWHPTAFGGGQLPEDIGELFWRLLDLRSETNDVWTSAAQFLSLFQERYRRVGLLKTETPVTTNESGATLAAS